MKKLKDILQEDCWTGYKQIGMKEKDGKQVPNCVPIKEEDEKKITYKPYMYSPVGFGCHVCLYYYQSDEGKHLCNNPDYVKYNKGSEELVDNNGDPITDPSKWCSNWFKPNK